MKPITYLTALKTQQYNPLSLLNDTKFSYSYANQNWSPKNYKNKYKGAVPLYKALALSLNVATAKLGLSLGIPAIIKTNSTAWI